MTKHRNDRYLQQPLWKEDEASKTTDIPKANYYKTERTIMYDLASLASSYMLLESIFQ